MDKKYFPHDQGGSLNRLFSKQIGFNFIPGAPIAIDPRTIINEWSDESLTTLTSDEVHVGLKIYDLSSNSNMVCYWVPGNKTEYNYTGAQCLWYKENDNYVEWVDVSTYVPEKSLNEKIEIANLSKWKYKNKEVGWYGTYNFDLSTGKSIEELLQDENTLNNVLTSLITYDNDSNYLNGTAKAYKFKEEYKNLLDKKEAPESVNNSNFIIFVPASYKKNVIKIKINDTEYNAIKVFDGDLTYMEKINEDYGTIYNEATIPFYAFSINEKIQESMLSSITVDILCETIS